VPVERVPVERVPVERVPVERVPVELDLPRLVVVRCPDWSVVAAGAAPDEPAAVLYANRVIARTPAAAVTGVRIGQRRREAHKTCPELRIIDHDPARDGREFEAAVRSVNEMVPRLETTEPGMLTFLAKGPARFFGGEHAMALRVAGLISAAIAVGADHRWLLGIGIADGRFTAGVAANDSALHSVRRADQQPTIIDPGRAATSAFLAPLSVATLRDVGGLSAELIDLLNRLGVHTLGALAALPGPDVLARFGAPGAFAHRIAGGGDDRPPGTATAPPDLLVARTFDDPVRMLDPLVFTAKQLAQELHELLAANGRVCTRLAVLAETEHGERSEHLWYRPHGLSATAIVERVRWQLDGWMRSPAAGSGTGSAAHSTGLTGGVVLLRLTPDEVRSDDGSQLGFWGGRTEADEWAVRAVSRVAALVGEQLVLVPSWRGGRLPGDAYEWVPVDRIDLGPDGTAEERLAVADVPWQGQLPAPSPATVLEEAMSAEVLDATGEAVWVNGRGVLNAVPDSVAINGRAPTPITAWAGPWPLDERWWDSQAHRRLARFQLTTERGTALLAIVENQQWWITAIY
jgi:protein ImuB